mgnify:FL=1
MRTYLQFLPLLLLLAYATSCAGEDGLIGEDDSGSIGLWGELTAVQDVTEEDRFVPVPDLPGPPPPLCLDELAPRPAQAFFSKDCADPELCPCSPADLGEVIGHTVRPATTAVDLCVMELQDFSVSGALVQASANGATFRAIVDDDYADAS